MSTAQLVGAAPPYADVVDARTGIVTALEAGEDGVWSARLCSTAALIDGTGGAEGGESVAPDTAGRDHDPARARAAAVGEALERYCGALVDPARLRWATYAELLAQGVSAVDPEALALHSSAQLAAPGFPFLGIDRRTHCAWVDGRLLAPGEPRVAVPAAVVWLVFGPHSRGRRLQPDGTLREGPCCFCVPGGVAAGPTRDQAIRAALAEVVERHTLATAWYAGETLRTLAAGQAWLLPNRWQIPVVLAHHGPANGQMVMGCAADADVDRALSRARSEAAQMARACAEIARGEWVEFPVGEPETIAAGYQDRGEPMGWDVTGAGLHGAVDITCHLHLGLDPQVQRRQWGRLTGAHEPAAHGDPIDRVEPLEGLRTDGQRVIVVDLTTSDVAALGVCVVRVIVPGLRSVGPTAFGFFGPGVEPLPGELTAAVIPHV